MPASAIEQMILELINRARLDPAAEAARDGIDLNEGLAAGTISAESKQPLAMNETLLTIARAHDQDMQTKGYFDHDDSTGATPFQRMTAAGYNFAAAGENIAWNATTGAVTTETSTDMEAELFIDAAISGRGHRLNLMNGTFQEVGTGILDNVPFFGYNASILTEDFGSTGTGQFLTGVSYNDTDRNNFYSIGEGRGGVNVSVSGGPSATTTSAGGYSLSVPAGQRNVTFSSGGLANPINVSVTVVAGNNAKVDMVDQGVIMTSASLTDISGASRIIGLGTLGLTLTGNSGNETFIGTKGDDTIISGGGSDSVVYASARSAYTVADISGGVQVSGPEGVDKLIGISTLVFADQTVALSTGGGPLVIGTSGNDTLASSTPKAFLFGAGGLDTISLQAAGQVVDLNSPGPQGTWTGQQGLNVIKGFVSGSDHLAIDMSAYGVSWSNFTFISGAGATPTSSQPTFAFDTSTSYLWFDPDGVGPVSARLVAFLPGVSALTAADLTLAQISFDATATVVNSTPNTTTYGEGPNETLWATGAVETLIGGPYREQFIVQGNNDTVKAGSGGAFIAALGGYSQLYSGSSGADTFYFNSPSAGVDTISGFSAANGDNFVLQGSAFAAPSGFRFTQGVGFISGPGITAVAATATLAYDTSTSYLWFDPDGTGPSGRSLLAFLPGSPALSASNFSIA